MKTEVYIPEHKDGITVHWEDDFKINVTNTDNEIIISSNKEGLVSLAIQLLTLAQNMAPIGSHIHYDEYNSLERGSVNLIIEKTV